MRRHENPDPDPTPRGWVVVDPATWWYLGNDAWNDEDEVGLPWQIAEDESDPFTTHTPTPTFVATRITTHTYGQHAIRRSHTIYTTQKPEEAQQ